MWTLIASYREPSDFGGLPVLKRETLKIEGKDYTVVELAPPGYALEAATDPVGGVIFLDELTCTPPAVQAPALRMVQELVVGELKLPADRVAVIAAANPPEMAAGGWELAPPLANRFTHIDYKLDPITWSENFPAHWADPPVLKLWGKELPEEKWAQARTVVAAYIHIRPAQILQFPKETDQQGKAWPSPRSWDHASRLMVSCDELGLNESEKHELIMGTIGPGVGTEFCTWIKALDLPDPEELLAHPEKLKMPTRGDKQFAVLSSVAMAAISVKSKKMLERWAQAWEVLVVASKVAPDVASSAARILAHNRPSKGNSPVPPKAAEVFAPIFKMAKLEEKRS